jgi:glycosyltransferase involved in cell wall biosynthesis
MRIGIDFSAALEEQAGIGRLTRELVGALVRSGTKHQYVLLGPRGVHWPAGLAALPNVRLATLPLPSRAMRLLWRRLHAPLAVDRWTGPIDLFHATDYTVPPHRAPVAVTVHDLSFLRHPEFAHPALARFLTASVPRAVADAALVLADSEYTRQEIIALLGAPPGKVRVVYGGVSPAFRPAQPAGVASVCDAFGLTPHRYLLTVSRLEPRKNITGLLHAWRTLLDRGENGGAVLAIGGSPGWRYQPIYDAIETLGLREHVRLLGHVPDAQLPALLSGAACFVYPSFYEGFGLPPLEALACGAPVVASNASCLPEVLGDAALYAPPADTDALAAAIARLLHDAPLRDGLRSRGLERAAAFTWEAAAAQLAAAYGSVAPHPAAAVAR